MNYRYKPDIDFVGDLGIIALKSHKEFGVKIDEHIKRTRRKIGLTVPDTYFINTSEERFNNGEGKIVLNETARGKDIFIICDIGNYSCTYKLYGEDNRMGPDEHFQDIKRAVAAIGGKAARVNVLMPRLYSSRQDRNRSRESLDCAMAMQELERLGVNDIITFDVHNSTVQNAVPLLSFDNLHASYEIAKAIVDDEVDIVSNKENYLIVSPDLGGMERAIYYASVLNIDVGMFYKRRDFSRVVDGRNPIVRHEFLGRDVVGKNILIVDDIIDSGESMAECIRNLKERKCNKVFIAVTFAQFTKGIKVFSDLHEAGMLTRVYATNLTYVPKNILDMDWITFVDMSPFAADVINNLNMNRSIAPILDTTSRLAMHLKSLGR